MAGRRHRVCVLVYEGLCLFEYALAVDLLQDRAAAFGEDWYQLDLCALEPSPVRGSGGVLVEAAGGIATLTAADTVIVPGWRMGPVPAVIVEALVAAHARGTRVASICTGAFVLAAAGLLDGRRATTHWRYADQLAAAHPAVQVDANVLYVDEGDILTSAGSAAGLDMLLHLVRRDYGARTCNAVARMMVVPPHRDGGQAQFFERPPRAHPSAFAEVMDSLQRDPARAWRIEELAATAAMTPRTFFRRFRAATGRTPYDWLLIERIRLAQALLEDGAMSIDQVALQAGFGGADTLRRHFRRTVGRTPSAFRRTFRVEVGA